ncbi:hypothetical protein BVX97_01080 [bacterium E08(2017)]|nr:hypothetical protein BVX97_01080 [bacterium E08(2017)]
MKRPVRVMLIEDSEDYRRVIACLLYQKSDIEVSREFGTSEIAIRTLQEMKPENKPDIILLDLNLPGLSGLDSIHELLQHAPESKIIILTQSDKEEDVLRGIQLGASGYILKSADLNMLIDGIHSVHSGGAIIDPSLAKFILVQLNDRLPDVESGATLTRREMEVLELVAEGLSQRKIASQLGISAFTVNEYVRNIYGKLDAQNAPSAVSKAYVSGVLFPKRRELSRQIAVS